MPGDDRNESDGISLSSPQEKYSFDSFICGDSNLLAYKAAFTVASGIAIYNPLFIYSRDSLGKTHLLKAIANHIRANEKTRKVAYCTSEQFMAEMLASLRSNKMDQFRCKFRNVDVLLLDDIQFFAGKERTQEELFHTFDALYELNKLIVITSDRAPSKIANLNAHLKGRFQCGLSVRIDPPEHKMKVEFIRRKVATLDVQFPDVVVQLLASIKQDNFRELEGSVVTVSAFSSLLGKPITAELVKEVLGKPQMESNCSEPSCHFQSTEGGILVVV